MYCTLLYIVMFAVLIMYLSLHCKNDWTSGILNYTHLITTHTALYMQYMQ